MPNAATTKSKLRNGELASYSAKVPPTDLGARTWEELWGQEVDQKARSLPDLATAVAKRRIFFSRDYRYIVRPRFTHILLGLALIGAWSAVMILFYSPLSLMLSNWTGHLVAGVCKCATGVGASAYLPNLGALHYVMVEGTVPSFTQLITALVVWIVVVVLSAMQLRNTLPLAIYVCMGGVLVLMSATFFLFDSQEFPYDLSAYSNLYMEQQVMLWLFVPVVGGISMFITDKRPITSTVCFLAIAVTNLLYGCIRYPLYLIFLHRFSSLYMASLFFVLGVLFDFMQMVAIYVVFVYDVSCYMDSPGHRGDWLW